MPDVSLTIDGQPVTAPAGTTILKAAASIGIAIPTICYHEACTANALCRLCVVEVEGARVLPPSCVAQVSRRDGGAHPQPSGWSAAGARSWRCWPQPSTCPKRLKSRRSCRIMPPTRERFPEAKRARARPCIDDNPMYIRDYCQVHPVLALRAGLRRGCPVYLCHQLSRARLRDPDRHLLRPAHAGNHLRLLRAVRGRLPHRRAQAQARVAAGAGPDPR